MAPGCGKRDDEAKAERKARPPRDFQNVLPALSGGVTLDPMIAVVLFGILGAVFLERLVHELRK